MFSLLKQYLIDIITPSSRTCLCCQMIEKLRMTLIQSVEIMRYETVLNEISIDRIYYIYSKRETEVFTYRECIN